MEPLSCNIITNTIDNGMIILDKDFNICAWNKWLEIRTDIKENDILGKNIFEEFPYINEKKLKRKVKSVLVTKNASFYSVDPHKFLIKIESSSIVDKIFDYMQQDITIIPYDIERGVVCIYIYDSTELNETNFKLRKVNEKLKDLSNKDPMTGAFNRRYFSEISLKYFNLSVRNKHEICVLILDIDNFKRINDTYGHQTGDEVIISLARNLENHVRQSDVVFRFGGEEFVVLLYNLTLEDAKNIAEKIRESIENLVIQTQKGELKYTLSGGIAQYNEEFDEQNLDKTLNRADKALYEAKNNGKNKVLITE